MILSLGFDKRTFLTVLELVISTVASFQGKLAGISIWEIDPHVYKEVP